MLLMSLVLLHSLPAYATTFDIQPVEEPLSQPTWVQYLGDQYPHMDLFWRYSLQYDLPLTWVLAIASVESGFMPRAMNIAGNSYFPKTMDEALDLDKKHPGKSKDYGLGQINSQWLRRFQLSAEQVLEPHVNIMLMSYILNECFNSWGSTMVAIGCYHHPPSKDMQRALDYARKVSVRQKQIERNLLRAGYSQG